MRTQPVKGHRFQAWAAEAFLVVLTRLMPEDVRKLVRADWVRESQSSPLSSRGRELVATGVFGFWIAVGLTGLAAGIAIPLVARGAGPTDDLGVFILTAAVSTSVLMCAAESLQYARGIRPATRAAPHTSALRLTSPDLVVLAIVAAGLAVAAISA